MCLEVSAALRLTGWLVGGSLTSMPNVRWRKRRGFRPSTLIEMSMLTAGIRFRLRFSRSRFPKFLLDLASLAKLARFYSEQLPDPKPEAKLLGAFPVFILLDSRTPRQENSILRCRVKVYFGTDPDH